MPHYPDEIEYSDKYHDDLYEYRHVLLPKAVYKSMPKGRLLTENEWRSLGVQQSRGWVHYEIHKPEPHILLFRRPLGTDPNTGIAPPEIMEKIKAYKEKLLEQQQNLDKELAQNKYHYFLHHFHFLFPLNHFYLLLLLQDSLPL